MSERDVVLEYKKTQICRNEHILFDQFDLQVEAGEFVYLTGAVGAGKSTLLKTIYADVPVQGEVARLFDFDLTRLKKRQIPELRRSLGIVFQDFQLLQDRTVYDNLDIVLCALGVKRGQERRERIEQVLSDVGLETKGYKYPQELSGGEQQRTAIARALLGRPRMLLADEPTGNLDPDSGVAITELLHRLAQETNAAVLMATHNLSVIQRFPARILDISTLHQSNYLWNH